MKLRPKDGWSLDSMAGMAYVNTLPITIEIRPTLAPHEPVAVLSKTGTWASKFTFKNGNVLVNGEKMEGTRDIIIKKLPDETNQMIDGIACMIDEQGNLDCKTGPWKSIFINEDDEQRIRTTLVSKGNELLFNDDYNGILYPDLVSPHVNEMLAFVKIPEDAMRMYKATNILEKAMISDHDPRYEKLASRISHSVLSNRVDRGNILNIYLADLETAIKQRKKGKTMLNPMQSIISMAPAMKDLHDPTWVRRWYIESTGNDTPGTFFRELGKIGDKLFMENDRKTWLSNNNVASQRWKPNVGGFLMLQHGQGNDMSGMNNIPLYLGMPRQVDIETWMKKNITLRNTASADIRRGRTTSRDKKIDPADIFLEREEYVVDIIGSKDPYPIMDAWIAGVRPGTTKKRYTIP